ncbi:protein lifeguard 3-like [Littorina saxatilis]|uniref:Uncharacterized protein n=1 Tax=Littorina saxatilis TaxID=31220 RepID=A0AAN9ATQ9_9CAEN
MTSLNNCVILFDHRNRAQGAEHETVNMNTTDNGYPPGGMPPPYSQYGPSPAHYSPPPQQPNPYFSPPPPTKRGLVSRVATGLSSFATEVIGQPVGTQRNDQPTGNVIHAGHPGPYAQNQYMGGPGTAYPATSSYPGTTYPITTAYVTAAPTTRGGTALVIGLTDTTEGNRRIYHNSSNIFTIVDMPTAIRFEAVNVRHDFVRKVYTILMVQMLIVFGIALPFFLNDDVKKYVHEHDTLVVAACASLAVTFFFGCICAENWKFAPGKYTCLVIVTANIAFLFAVLTGYYDSEVPLEMAASAFVVALVFFLMTYQEKLEFSHSSGLLLVLCVCVVMGAVSAVLASYVFTWEDRVWNSVWASIATLIICLSQAYNLGLMVCGERNAPITMDHEMYAAIKVYLNIVLLPLDSIFIVIEFSDYLFGWRRPRNTTGYI